MSEKNFYEILGVPRAIDKKDLTARFRDLVRERHPDRFQGEEKAKAETEFQAITEAFNVLRDDKRRYEHDQEIDRPAQRGHDPSQLAKVFLKRGIRAYKEERFMEAADNFNRATEAEPQNAQAWHHLAMACMQEAHWLPRAQEAIERACSLRAGHVPYLKLAGKIFVQSGMRQKAKEYYNQALTLAGDSDLSLRKALRDLEGSAAKKAGASETETDKAERTGLFGKKLW